MNTSSFELQVMVIERMHSNTLYYAQQVKKNWRCYILENSDKLRPSIMKKGIFDKRVMSILIEILHSSNSRKYISREAINSLELTDFEVIRCIKLLLHQLMENVKFFFDTVFSIVFNHSMNAENTLEFVATQLPLLAQTRKFHLLACEILRVDVNLKDSIDELTSKWVHLIVLVREGSPATNDTMYIHAVDAMNTIDNHGPLEEMSLINEALKNFNFDESFSSGLEALRRLFEAVLPCTRAVIQTLKRGIEQFVRDLKEANLYTEE